MPKINKRTVDAVRPEPGRDVFVWDSELRGFGLRVKPSGAGAYVIQYRNARNGIRRLVVGKLGTLTPEQARAIARQKLAAVAAGEDPAEERATRRKAVTVRQLCERYLEAAERGLILGKRQRPKRPSTMATDRGRIERHIVPLLGHKPAAEVTPVDVNRFLRDVMSGKTKADIRTGFRGRAIVEGGAGTATRTVGLLGGIFSFAVSEGIVAANPVRGVRRPADNRRDVRLTPEQYRQLGKALEELAAEGENPLAIAAVRLLCLTGCRRGEVERLSWSALDEVDRCLRLTDTKEGDSLRPAGQPVFDVLRMIARSEGCAFVLPGRDPGKPFAGLPRAWKRIAKRAGFAGVTPHALRHSFASVANDLGYTEPTIAALLGHSTGSVTRRYIHHLDIALVAAADRVARRIAEWMADPVDVENSSDPGRH